MSFFDHLAYGVGVLSLCAMAAAAVWTIITTIAEHCDQVREALYGTPVRDRYDDAVEAVDADLRESRVMRWAA